MNELKEEGTNEWILCLLITILYKTDVRANKPSFPLNQAGEPSLLCIYMSKLSYILQPTLRVMFSIYNGETNYNFELYGN